MDTIIVALAYNGGVLCLGILILFFGVLWLSHSPSRRKSEMMMLLCVYSIPGAPLLNTAPRLLAKAFQFRLDRYIYRIDSIYGEPAFRLAQIVSSHFWLGVLAVFSYSILIEMILTAVAANIYFRSRENVREVVCAFIFTFLLAPGFYLAFPVSGPLFAFQTFPNLPSAFVTVPIFLNAEPNGIPSVHMAIALLSAWYLRYWKLGIATGCAFVLLTVLSTLGTGQHYVFDLVCAIPYVMLVIWLARPDNRRVAQFSGLKREFSHQ